MTRFRVIIAEESFKGALHAFDTVYEQTVTNLDVERVVNVINNRFPENLPLVKIPMDKPKNVHPPTLDSGTLLGRKNR